MGAGGFRFAVYKRIVLRIGIPRSTASSSGSVTSSPHHSMEHFSHFTKMLSVSSSSVNEMSLSLVAYQNRRKHDLLGWQEWQNGQRGNLVITADMTTITVPAFMAGAVFLLCLRFPQKHGDGLFRFMMHIYFFVPLPFIILLCYND